MDVVGGVGGGGEGVMLVAGFDKRSSDSGKHAMLLMEEFGVDVDPPPLVGCIADPLGVRGT